ncbi:MAG: hypothetical protein ABFS05_03805 [Bacteroidota bacterium]
MMNFKLFFIAIVAIVLMFACTTTEETTTDNTNTLVDVQQWQEQQKRIEKGAERSGLTPDVVQTLNDYAEEKAALVCELQNLDKSVSEALSTATEQDHKESIIKIDEQLTKLSQEIDEYCKDDESRQQYFNQLMKRYTRDCQ